MEEILLWIRVIGVLFLGTWAIVETIRCGRLEDELSILYNELEEIEKND